MNQQNNDMNRVTEDVKKMREIAQHSGLTYNQAKAYIAQTCGGTDTAKYSDTNVEEVRNDIGK